HHLLVAAIRRDPARLLVVVGSTDRRHRADLPRPLPHFGRLRPLREPETGAPLMTVAQMVSRDAAPAVPVLEVEGLNVHYDTASGPAKAVADVSFSLRPGERLGLIGESGSGKTTMATALMRLTRAPGRIVSGSIRLEGHDILKMDARELRATRLRDIALIP